MGEKSPKTVDMLKPTSASSSPPGESKPPPLAVRFVIWTAVSSETQAAADKASLPEQEARCREAALARGWRESAGPFIVPGESRTRWVNLRDAEAAIPALRAMLDAASRREFDILVLYAYDRLRELLDPVARTLAAYGVQLFSISQPVEPQPPEEFDLYATDTANAVQFVSSLTSRAEINALRRRYRLGVPRRVSERGLHAVGPLPFGYRKPPGRELDPNAVPIPDPETAAALIQTKDLLLSGRSLHQVTEWLNATGVRPRRAARWDATSLRKMLTNPFYAGFVRYGVLRRRRDPRTGAVQDMRVEGSQNILSARGRHEPLWDEATWHELQEELRRRARSFKSAKTQRLSHLLYCAECQRPLYIGYVSSQRDDAHRVWYCPRDHGRWHNFIYDAAALEQLIARLVADLSSLEGLVLTKPEDHREMLENALQDLMRRRERLIDALEDGHLDAILYAARSSQLEERLKEVRGELEKQQRAAERSATRVDRMRALRETIETIPDYLRQAPPQEVNAQLRHLVDRVLIPPGGGLQILYR